jgi:capsular polysaccharide biosynthesis protein
MEIGTYVRGLLTKSWIVVLLAVLAGAGAYVAERGVRDAYQATVNVTVPAAAAATAGSNGQYVANFSVGLTTPGVVADVSQQTGESKNALTDGLAADQLGNSSFISVTYTAPDAATAVEVVDSAAKSTSTLLAQPAVQTATNALTSAKQALTTATAQQTSAQDAVSAYTAKHGLIDPNVLYNATQSSLTQLNVSKQNAIAQGRSTSNFDTAIASAQARLTALAPQVVEYNALSRSLNQAELATQTAQSRVITAAGDLASANAAPLIGDPTSSLVSRSSVVRKAVAVAAGLGLVLGLALILLVEFLAATRRPRPVDGPTPSTERTVAEPSSATAPAAGPDASAHSADPAPVVLPRR